MIEKRHPVIIEVLCIANLITNTRLNDLRKVRHLML